ncbi:MAG: hypothetical protein KIT69_12485, partial [Propionibacteriaceae bacterium]|nr:hypothetical protein [Propionibacteriaceae bacterium]
MFNLFFLIVIISISLVNGYQVSTFSCSATGTLFDCYNIRNNTCGPGAGCPGANCESLIYDWEGCRFISGAYWCTYEDSPYYVCPPGYNCILNNDDPNPTNHFMECNNCPISTVNND